MTRTAAATVTIAEVEDRFGVAMLDHLDREAELPAVTDRPVCQGDVSVLPVTTGSAKTPIPPQGVAVVVGENGGNTHSLHGDGFYDPAPEKPGSLTLGTLRVPAGKEAFLLHPEHGGFRALGGKLGRIFRIGRQREFAGEWRTVAD